MLSGPDVFSDARCKETFGIVVIGVVGIEEVGFGHHIFVTHATYASFV
jgi:hypothetical protein